jgi:hypothetical protein
VNTLPCPQHQRPVHFIDEGTGQWLCRDCWRARFDEGDARREREIEDYYLQHEAWHHRVGSASVQDCSVCDWALRHPPKSVGFITIEAEPFEDKGESW